MRILLVEDEAGMAAAMVAVLEREGYVVDQVTSLAETLEAARLAVSDVVLLDRTLPDGDGIAAIDDIRRFNPGVPVIVISARGDIDDRVAGLDTGADDYLAKPFAMEELLARIRAVRRRPAALPHRHVQLGELVYDMRNDEALVRGVRLDLPRRELRVLAALMRRRGRTVLRGALEEAVYGFDDEIQSNTLDSHVSRLRKRLSEAHTEVEIHAIRGVGYLLRQAL
ncbi:response regulator transcription factor [Sphingomonas psychrotolerans]|uniref:DNA-binding response regulator n=1 Tax=Sphingomonas psychrotolerans TaxID=1327635 RepID=A0A2K8MF08_9SPHN|nr:response regulator transcription factor [Sphingomonas psychrotolerans]ATY31116.1 DNA-binding response regulator [Sphingomonas psychrotolerans]